MKAFLRRLSVDFEKFTRQWVIQQWTNKYPKGLTAALNSGDSDLAVKVFEEQCEKFGWYDPELIRVKVYILDPWLKERNEKQ